MASVSALCDVELLVLQVMAANCQRCSLTLFSFGTLRLFASDRDGLRQKAACTRPSSHALIDSTASPPPTLYTGGQAGGAAGNFSRGVDGAGGGEACATGGDGGDGREHPSPPT